MDKNLVNIDDLFKQRMSGGEEKEREGAWMNMRDLLDKEMPAQPIAGFKWRRMLTYTAGLLLLASATFGGYEAMTAFKTTSSGNTNTGTNNAVPNSNGTTDSRAVAATTVHNTANNTSNTSSASLAANTQVGAIDSKSVNNKTTNNNREVTTAESIASTKQIASIHMSKYRRSTHTIQTQPQTQTFAKTTAKKAAGNTNNNTVNAATSVANNKTATSRSGKSVGHQLIAVTNVGNSAVAANTPTQVKKGHKKAANAKILPAASVATVNTSNTVVQNQKVNKLEVVQRDVTKPWDRNGHYINDTIDRSTLSISSATTTTNQQPGSGEQPTVATAVAKNSNTPAGSSVTGTQNATSSTAASQAAAAKNGIQNTAGNNILLASAAKNVAATTNTSDMVTHHTKRKSSTLANFAEMIFDFRTNLGNAKFAPGIAGGINATFFAPNGISGFQLGITGNFILNEKWSIFGELKYFNRFSAATTIIDNYVTYTALSNGGYQKDSVQQSFRYNNLQSVELPVALQYTLGKCSMFAGGNLVYNFSIYNDFQQNALSPEITTQPGRSIVPQYTPNDFVSRIGIGYLLGGCYYITPQLRADARIVQTVWDNSSSTGSQLLSRNLYKNPSLQLSIGYTFKKKENRMP